MQPERKQTKDVLDNTMICKKLLHAANYCNCVGWEELI